MEDKDKKIMKRIITIFIVLFLNVSILFAQNYTLPNSEKVSDNYMLKLEKVKKLGNKLNLLKEAKNIYETLKKNKNHKQYYFKHLKNYLLVVASYNEDIKIMQELLKNGANINFLQNLNKQYLRVLYPINPLLAASKNKKYKSVKFLLKNGANISTKDWYNQTALVYALDGATKKDRKLISLLIRNKIDTNIQFDAYKLALSEVYFRPLNFSLIFTKDLQIVKMLAKKADLEILTGQDDTHITRWLSRFYDKKFNFSCERFKFALGITTDKSHIDYHKNSILTYLLKKYDSYNIPFTKECSRVNAINMYLGRKKDTKLSINETTKLNKKEKIRIFKYIEKRDYPTNLLKSKKLEKLYKLIQNTKDINTLAKTKTNSFLYDVMNQFINKIDVMGDYQFLLYSIGKRDISKKEKKELEFNKKLLKIAKLLIDKGADINQRGSLFTSRTPLSRALESISLYPEFQELSVYMMEHNPNKKIKKIKTIIIPQRDDLNGVLG